jgi:hypothetical protein
LQLDDDDNAGGHNLVKVVVWCHATTVGSDGKGVVVGVVVAVVIGGGECDDECDGNNGGRIVKGNGDTYENSNVNRICK